MTWQLQLVFTYYCHGLYTTVNNPGNDPGNGGMVHHLCHFHCLNKSEHAIVKHQCAPISREHTQSRVADQRLRTALRTSVAPPHIRRRQSRRARVPRHGRLLWRCSTGHVSADAVCVQLAPLLDQVWVLRHPHYACQQHVTHTNSACTLATAPCDAELSLVTQL